MAGNFVMGATLNLQTNRYTSQVRQAASITQQLQTRTTQASNATGTYYNSQGRLINSMGRYVSATNNATDQTQQLGRAAQTTSRGLGGLKAMVGTVFAGFTLKKGFDWLVQSNADMETYRNTLAVVMKSQEKANETLEWATTFAAKTPFEIPGVVEATTRLTAYGLAAENTLPIIGDMASVMGKDLMQAVEAVADAQTGELERMKEFGITKKMIEDQAKMMKVTVTNNKGQITDQKAFNAVLFSLMEDRFKGGMELQAGTFKGMLSNLGDFVGTMGRKLGEPIFDAFKGQLGKLIEWLNVLEENGTIDAWVAKISDGMKSAGEFVVNTANFFRDNWGWIEPVVAGVAGAVTAFYVATKLAAAGAFISAKYTAIMAAVAQAGSIKMAILNAVMAVNPAVWVALAIGVLIAAVILAYRNIDLIKEKIAAAWEVMKGWGTGIKTAFSEAWGHVTDFFKNLGTSLFNSGAKIIDTIVSGIKSKAMAPVTAVKGIFGKVRDLLPFSDAKKGPFSNLTLNGGRIMTTLADGVKGESKTLQRAVDGAFSNSGVSVNATAVNPAGSNKAATNNSTVVQKLFESIVIQGTEGMDEEALVNKLIEKLYELLREADDILGGGKGVLLNG